MTLAAKSKLWLLSGNRSARTAGPQPLVWYARIRIGAIQRSTSGRFLPRIASNILVPNFLLLRNGGFIREVVWNVGSSRFRGPKRFYAFETSLRVRYLGLIQIQIIMPEPILILLHFDLLLLFRELVEGWYLRRRDLFGKFSLSVSHMSRFYSEVRVASRVSLRDHGGWPLLVFDEGPDRVLSHTLVFERFHLRADTFQGLDKSFVAFYPIFQLGRKVPPRKNAMWLILI